MSREIHVRFCESRRGSSSWLLSTMGFPFEGWKKSVEQGSTFLRPTCENQWTASKLVLGEY